MPLKLLLKEKQTVLQIMEQHRDRLLHRFIINQRKPTKIERKHLIDAKAKIRELKFKIMGIEAELEVYDALNRMGLIERDPLCGGRGCKNCSHTGFVLIS